MSLAWCSRGEQRNSNLEHGRGGKRPARHGLRPRVTSQGSWREEVTVAQEEEKLKLGKGAAFVKGRFKRLRQEDETWEADFQALSKPATHTETHYLGMVVAPDGSFLADSYVEGRPTVNDMATLLAQAMLRPLAGKA